jgi:16S rRNA (cytidine1402-2'-O)-methyltransferase
LKILAPDVPVSEHSLQELDKHQPENNGKAMLQPCLEGHDMGLISDAGVPGVADPGARIVEAAHAAGIQVVPWVGPSSILLGLMASGFNGQGFQFHGYLTHDGQQRRKLWGSMERSIRDGQTQLFIETPYRNDKLMEELMTLPADLHLCVACDLTAESEYILSQSIAQWRKSARPSLHKRPAIFLLGRPHRRI